MTKELLTGANLKGPLQLNGAAGTSGQILTSAGTGAIPTWTTASSSFSTTIATLSTTVSSSSTTLANVTDLVVALAANATYRCDVFIIFRSDFTTTGLALGFTSPTGCSPMVEVVVPITQSAASSALRITFPNGASTTSGSVIGTSVSATGSNHTARISGIIKNGSTAGNFQIQFASEVNSTSVQLQAGSILTLAQIA